MLAQVDDETRAVADARRGRARTAALALLLGLGPAGAPAAAQETPGGEDAHEIRSFAIPETSLSRALMERAREHVAARRWSEAIQALQSLLEDHRHEVLAGSTRGEDGEWRSQQPVHLGASAEAARMLAELPDPARALYVDRFAQEASAALTRARAAGERAPLAEVARRYPLTPAARSAWWSLGDLELELGHVEAARAAWRRAASAAERAGEELTAGARARLEFAFPAELDDGTAEPPGAAAELASTPPGPGSQSWRIRIDDGGPGSPFSPAYHGEGYNLLPVLAGDLVLVSNTLRLIAVDAWTGRIRWESAEAPGWMDVDRGRLRSGDGSSYSRDEFFEAIDRDALLVAPAAQGRVAVAALQIPVTQIDNTNYQRIRITTIIPDRRLFAFDLETGRELWNHLPPPGWDGETGSFTERMRVAGPPTIAGSRLLVPVYRLQGRVDYHVACYDLFSGELLWSTGVISGQLPLNMFGRHAREFSAAPLVVEGESVLALTQLGAVAALDLYTGDLLWETLYERLPLPRNEHRWDAPSRRQYWNNTAPLVQDGLVLATPLDSTDLIALDAGSGAMLWSISQAGLVGRRPLRERWTLAGVDEDTVYLAGTSVAACRAPGGLAGPRPPTDTQSSPLLSTEPPPRPAFGERWIVAPTAARRVVLDRFNLRFENRQLSSSWEDDQQPGNALSADGALFTLSGKYLTGVFDWAIQERRFEAALAADPLDHPLALSYGSMLLDRARSAVLEADHGRALSHLARAVEELEPRTALDAGALRAQAEAGLYRALRLEAEVLAREADSSGALTRLARARELAPDLEELRNTLLESARIHANRGDAERRLTVLDALERHCGALRMPSSTSALEPRGAVAVPPARGGRTVGLWVLTERAREMARRGEVGAELDVLHTVLAAFGDATLSAEVQAPRASERIAELLAEHGRDAYAPFEERARVLLESSLAEDDAAGLDRVVGLYPHSEAARRAGAARIEHAWRSGRTEVLAGLVQRALPQRWIPETATPEEVAALLKLGALLGADGNLDLEAGLLGMLARAHPELAPDAPPGPALDQRAAETALAVELDASVPVSSFDASAVTTRPFPGDHQLIGRVPRRAGRGDEPELLLVAAISSRRTETIQALSTAGPQTPLWSRSIERARFSPGAGRQHALLPDALVVAAGSGLSAISPRDGQVLWERELEGEGVEALAGATGVVVATLTSSEGGTRLLALDASGGVELWSCPVDRAHHPAPVLGPEHVVLLPRKAESAQAEVRDLFTGRLALQLELSQDVGDADLRGAWIEGALLVLPSFPRAGAPATSEGDRVVGLDLRAGRRAWRVPRESVRELDSIVRCGRDAYLVLFATPFSGGASGGLVQLDTRLGAVRQVPGVRLSLEDAPIGVRRSTVVTLDEPFLFVLSPLPGGRDSQIRALHLPLGERWVHRLPVPPDEVYNTPLPLPALSATTVTLAYTEIDRSLSARAQPRTTLLLLDRASGLPRDARLLPDLLGRADALRVSAFGPALLVAGRDGFLIVSKE